GDERGGLAGSNWVVLLPQPGGQTPTGTIGGSDVADRANHARLVHGHDAGMFQAGSGPTFPKETLAQRGIDQCFGTGHLERDQPLEMWILSQVDDAKAAAPQLTSDAEAAEASRGGGKVSTGGRIPVAGGR